MPVRPNQVALPPAGVTVLTGPAGCGKTTLLLERYREVLRSQPMDSALWLAPTQRAVREIKGRLLDEKLRACLAPNVLTFAQLAERILGASEETLQPIRPWMKRQLIRRLLAASAAEGRLRHFASIADRPGLVDLFSQFISELKRLEIWPEAFGAACQKRGMEEKDRELLEVYEAYQLRLNERQLYDSEGRFWLARDLLARNPRRPFEALQLVVVDGFTDFTRTEHEMLAVLARQAASFVVSLPLEAGDQRADLFGKSTGTLGRLEQLGKLSENRPQRGGQAHFAPKNLSENRLGEGDSPILLGGTRKIGTVPDGFRIGSKAPQNEPVPDGFRVVSLDRPSSPAWPTLAHVERELFKNPRIIEVAREPVGIDLYVAPRVLAEIEHVGRTIKQLFVEGDSPEHKAVRPSDVAVVFRSLTGVAPLVREVFAGLGLPVAIEAAEPLGQARLLGALVNVLRLRQEDWPFNRLLSLVTSAYYRPRCEVWQRRETPAAVELAIRELQLPSGREQLLTLLQRRATEDLSEPEPQLDDEFVDERQQARIARRKRAQLALGVLHTLDEALNRLPTRAGPAAWAEALITLAGELGFLETTQLPDAPAACDRAAWSKLIELVAGGDAAWRDLGEAVPELDLGELLDWLVDLLANEQIPRAVDETGCVRVLSARSARALQIPYLFFAGLSEKAFPPPDREDRFYSEAECQRLREHDLPLVLRGERNQEEMLLFYEVLTRATRRLYLSYPGLDEKAQSLLPSPYLGEVQQLLGLNDQAPPPELSPLVMGEQPQGTYDQRVLAVSQVLAGRPHMLAGLWQAPQGRPVAENISAALTTLHARAQREGFGDWEGVFAGGEAARELAKTFGPHHKWSPSDLELYGYCPYRFLIERVLKVEPLPELALEIDYGARGSRLHATLARLHRKLARLDSSNRSLASLSEDEFQRLAEEAIAETFERFLGESLSGTMAEVDRRLVLRWLGDYREQHDRYEQPPTSASTPPQAAHFEVSFGIVPKATDPLSTTEPLRLQIEGEVVLLAGRIDRVDLGQTGAQPWFNVLDYKTSKMTGFSPKKVESGELLQLPLYALAAQDLLLAARHAVPWQTGYWFVREKGFKSMLELYTPEGARWELSETWRRLKPLLLKRVAETVHGVRTGQFPVACQDKDCTGRCELYTVCRINHIRSLEKKWPPPPPATS